MEFIWWIIIALLFIVGMIGVVYPIIPGVLLLWAGFFVYIWLLEGALSVWFWTGMAILTIFIIVADIVSNMYFVQKNGGDRTTQWVAIIGVIVGGIIYPPFGIVLVPFGAVLILEWIRLKDVKKASKIALATIIAFLSSSLAKFIIQMMMIIWFVLQVIFYN